MRVAVIAQRIPHLTRYTILSFSNTLNVQNERGTELLLPHI